MTRETADRPAERSEKSHIASSPAADFSRQAQDHFKSIKETKSDAKADHPTGTTLNFEDHPNSKPLYPQYAGLNTKSMNDALPANPYDKNGDYRISGPDSVVGKSNKINGDGGHIDSSVHKNGEVDTTTFDSKNQAIKNRTEHPNGAYSEQTLDKKNNVRVYEHQPNGDYSDTHVSHDGKVTSKTRTSDPDLGHTEVDTKANGVIDTTKYSEKNKIVGKKHENPDGSYHERKVNPDNSITIHDQKKDGSYVESNTNSKGTSRTIHDVDKEGGSTTKTYDPKGKVVADRVTQPDGSYLETKKNDDGTTTKHDQRANGNYTEATLNDKGQPVSPTLDVKHTASPEFQQSAKDQIASLPDNVKQMLAKNGTRISIAGTLVDAAPELAGKPLSEGHDKGSTFNDIEGVYLPQQVVVAERTSKGDSNRLDGAVRHEVGHAVDAILGKKSDPSDPDSPVRLDSNSPEFIAAYNKDVANMTPEQKQRDHYEVKENQGRGEAFAEVFGAVNGGSANRNQTGQVLGDFPNTAEYMKKRLAGIQ